MSDQKIVLTEGDVFLSPEDRRSENYRLALRLFVRELRSLKNESVDRVLKHWSVAEIEMGDSIKLGISFPDDVERYQWFRTEGFELRKVPGVKNEPKTKKA